MSRNSRIIRAITEFTSDQLRSPNIHEIAVYSGLSTYKVKLGLEQLISAGRVVADGDGFALVR